MIDVVFDGSCLLWSCVKDRIFLFPFYFLKIWNVMFVATPKKHKFLLRRVELGEDILDLWITFTFNTCIVIFKKWQKIKSTTLTHLNGCIILTQLLCLTNTIWLPLSVFCLSPAKRHILIWIASLVTSYIAENFTVSILSHLLSGWDIIYTLASTVSSVDFMI